MKWKLCETLSSDEAATPRKFQTAEGVGQVWHKSSKKAPRMNKKRKLKHSTKLGTGREKWNHNIGVIFFMHTLSPMEVRLGRLG
jgi:hypothetical protein